GLFLPSSLWGEEDFIIKSMNLIQESFKRQAGLHYLKTFSNSKLNKWLSSLEKGGQDFIRSLLEKERNFQALDGHYLLNRKLRERQIFNYLANENFHSLPKILEYMKGQKYPLGVPFVPLLLKLKVGISYLLKKDQNKLSPSLKEDFQKEKGELNKVLEKWSLVSGHSMEKYGREIFKKLKSKDFPFFWYDGHNQSIALPYPKWIPFSSKSLLKRLDLNKATEEDLSKVPGMEGEFIQKILKYRKIQGGFEGPEELQLLGESIRQIEAWSCLFYASHVSKKKEWTCLVYINGDNDLEPAALDDINEMERVGSTSKLNILVQVDRFEGKQGKILEEKYLRNPYAPLPGYTFRDDGFHGARRYYILKDQDPSRIRSVLKEELGEVDMGSPKSLAAFMKWGIQNYPARHYALFIWDHGTGWKGVSYDESNQRKLSLWDIRNALKEVQVFWGKNGERKRKWDILDFDACLMASLEIGYELKDFVRVLVASQDLEPDPGNPYDAIFQFLKKYPEAEPVSFAKHIVAAFVRSYSPGGKQLEEGEFLSDTNTKVALDLSKIEGLAKEIHQISKMILKEPKLLERAYLKAFDKVLFFSDKEDGNLDLYGLFDFFRKRASPGLQKKIGDLLTRICFFPKASFVHGYTIKRTKPGKILWGWNGWKTGENRFSPFVHKSRYFETPLTGPDGKGFYWAVLRLPPFLEDPKSEEKVLVKEINYRFDDEEEEHKILLPPPFRVEMEFPPESPLLALGYGIYQHGSYGISIYFPPYGAYDGQYESLAFSRNLPGWQSLISHYPLYKLPKKKTFYLVGFQHWSASFRRTLSQIVVKEAYQKVKNEYEPGKDYIQ
ncbi:MAG: hypothetical protein D6785_10665, partial [Planctomycetota bacterium]